MVVLRVRDPAPIGVSPPFLSPYVLPMRRPSTA